MARYKVEHAVEPVLPDSQYREAGASWICSVGSESRQPTDCAEPYQQSLTNMTPTPLPHLLTRTRSREKWVFLQPR